MMRYFFHILLGSMLRFCLEYFLVCSRMILACYILLLQSFCHYQNNAELNELKYIPSVFYFLEEFV